MIAKTKPGFFPIAAEMHNPSLYTRSLLSCQSAVTAIYIAIGTVLYYYCGSYVASPALGSAGTLIKKIAYGIALPGLVASTVIVLHVSKIRVANISFLLFLTNYSSQVNISSSASCEVLNI